jgi:hypothetical protein
MHLTPMAQVSCAAIRGQPQKRLLALSSLVARPGQQLAVLVFSHLLATLLDHTTQSITPF